MPLLLQSRRPCRDAHALRAHAAVSCLELAAAPSGSVTDSVTDFGKRCVEAAVSARSLSSWRLILLPSLFSSRYYGCPRGVDPHQTGQTAPLSAVPRDAAVAHRGAAGHVSQAHPRLLLCTATRPAAHLHRVRLGALRVPTCGGLVRGAGHQQVEQYRRGSGDAAPAEQAGVGVVSAVRHGGRGGHRLGRLPRKRRHTAGATVSGDVQPRRAPGQGHQGEQDERGARGDAPQGPDDRSSEAGHGQDTARDAAPDGARGWRGVVGEHDAVHLLGRLLFRHHAGCRSDDGDRRVDHRAQHEQQPDAGCCGSG
eukprot:ctg_962.g379